MTSSEFKRWLTKQGCTFESGRGGHLIVRLKGRMSVLPMHGKQKVNVMDYPITLTKDDNDTWLVGFPDFPEAHTFGETVDDALVRAKDAITTIVETYIKDRREIPAPSASTGELVAVPALLEAKVRLYSLMRKENVGKADLARRMGVHLPQVDRLLNVRHGSTIDQLATAFKVMGKRLVVNVLDAPVTKAPRPRRVVKKATVSARVLKAAIPVQPG